MRLDLQVLTHNRRQHHHLRIQIVQRLPIRQEQPVRDLRRQPGKVAMRREQIQRAGGVARVQLLEPADAAVVVRPVALPVAAREAVLLVLGALQLADGQDGLDGLADADDDDGFEEGLAQALDEGLAGGGAAVGFLRGQVQVQLVAALGVRARDDGGDGEDVPFFGGQGGRGRAEAGLEGLEELLVARLDGGCVGGGGGHAAGGLGRDGWPGEGNWGLT